MKILFANKFFFPQGGAETVMFDEIKLMKDLNCSIVEFSMHELRNFPSEYSSYFVSNKDYRAESKLTRLKSALTFIHSTQSVSCFKKLLSATEPDVVHFHNIYHQLTPSIINVASRMKIPTVLTLHDYKVICPIYNQLRTGPMCTKCSEGRFESLLMQRCAGGSLGRSALLWAEARYHAALRSYHRVDRFIAPSLFMRNAVVGRYGNEKVMHIPNGVDVSRLKPSPHADEGFVLYLGRLSPEKGVVSLLKAHAADNGAWRLVIAGTGPLLDGLRSQFPAAEFTGFVTGSALEAVIAAASIIAVPSEWHENCPMSVLEAMALGKPVVASRIGGIPELVRDGRTGLLFSPKNISELTSKIQALLSNSDLRRRLGAEARKVAETEYSLQKHGETLFSLYRDVISANQAERTAGFRTGLQQSRASLRDRVRQFSAGKETPM